MESRINLRERILVATSDKSGIDILVINEGTKVAHLKIDSLSFMDLIMQIEEREGIVLDDIEINSILEAKTMGEIVDIFHGAIENLRT